MPCQYDFPRRVVRDGGKRKEPYNSTLIVFMTWFIVYLEKGLHLTLSKAGLGASIPYLMATVGMLAGGFLSDSLLKKGKSVTVARKLPVTVGLVLTAMSSS